MIYSIALHESGKKHSTSGKLLPWPWAVNVEGAGYHFNTKEEAVKFVKAELAKGKKSIDVGCMQINLKHHPKAFASIEEAFDPARNVNYGAQFLESKYAATKSWKTAIAHYHSATEFYGKRYLQSVTQLAMNIDKHKVPAQRSGLFMDIATTRLYPLEGYKPLHKKYRSQLMVYVPRQENKKLL